MGEDDDENSLEWRSTWYIGQHLTRREQAASPADLATARGKKYDMITTTITNVNFTKFLDLCIKQANASDNYDGMSPTPLPSLSPNFTTLIPQPTTSQLIGVINNHNGLESPRSSVIDLLSDAVLLQANYAAFCGVDNLIIDVKNMSQAAVLNLAQIIRRVLTTNYRQSVHVSLPASEGFDSWDCWNAIRKLCDYHSRLFVALEIPPQTALSIQSRWASEPVNIILLTPDSFVANQKGYPALVRSTQAFLARLMRAKVPPWIFLTDLEEFYAEPQQDPQVLSPTPAEAMAIEKQTSSSKNVLTMHLDYLRYLQREQKPKSDIEQWGSGYKDYLQIPLQPLTDNLESLTYEVFEKDPVKYDLYQEAIEKALRKLLQNSHRGSQPRTRSIVLAVCGAGRGPLITRAIRASAATGIDIEIWGLEKNPNAFSLLQHHNTTNPEWKGRVNLVQSDMRAWKGPELPIENEDEDDLDLDGPDVDQTSIALSEMQTSQDAQPQNYPIDILVSELLGSFGDNELSPECLDGVLHLLSKDGISIPSTYTAFLTPISCPKVFSETAQRKQHDETIFETPAVVWLWAIDFLSRDHSIDHSQQNNDPAQLSTSGIHPPILDHEPLVLKAWDFKHNAERSSPPEFPINNAKNARFSRMSFPVQRRGVCHGLAGYFESVLFDDVELSTHPFTMEDKSKDMTSWFPMYFPLKTPIYLPDDAELVVSMWRRTDNRQVWYEWVVEAYVYRPNGAGGRSRERLGGGELQSSIKHACLM